MRDNFIDIWNLQKRCVIYDTYEKNFPIFNEGGMTIRSKNIRQKFWLQKKNFVTHIFYSKKKVD